MAVVEIADADDPARGDPRLSDYARATDVALRKARGTEHGLYIAESTLVLQRALGAGHTPRSVLALPGMGGCGAGDWSAMTCRSSPARARCSPGSPVTCFTAA